MKKYLCFISIFICFTITACNTSDENNTRVIEEREDNAAEAADDIQDIMEEYDTTSVKVEQ
jgi:hypothetical protein